MSEKLKGFLEVSADFGESFLRRSGRGIIEGANRAFRLMSEFVIVGLAVYFSMQFLEAEKACNAKKSITHAAKEHKTRFVPPQRIVPNQTVILNPEGK